MGDETINLSKELNEICWATMTFEVWQEYNVALVIGYLRFWSFKPFFATFKDLRILSIIEMWLFYIFTIKGNC